MSLHSRLFIGAMMRALSVLPVHAASVKQAKKLYTSDNYIAAMVTRLTIKLGDDLEQGEALFQQYFKTHLTKPDQ